MISRSLNWAALLKALQRKHLIPLLRTLLCLNWATLLKALQLTLPRPVLHHGMVSQLGSAFKGAATKYSLLPLPDVPGLNWAALLKALQPYQEVTA
jgi:hypothetical protein